MNPQMQYGQFRDANYEIPEFVPSQDINRIANLECQIALLLEQQQKQSQTVQDNIPNSRVLTNKKPQKDHQTTTSTTDVAEDSSEIETKAPNTSISKKTN